MAEYELAVLLHPDLEIDQQKPLNKIDKFIAATEGKLIQRDDWGKRKLAYPIKNQQFALYYIYRIELPGPAIVELEHNLVISDEVLRHLLVKADSLPPEGEATVQVEQDEQSAQTDARTPVTRSTANKVVTKTKAQEEEK